LEEKGKLGLLAVIAAALVILFLRLGAYPLLDPDEARFARTSVEMMRSHDYVVPTFEGVPRLVKPPLLHWIQVALFDLAGPGELMARLPAAGATFVSLLLVGWIGWRRFGVEGAAWSTAIFLTFPLVAIIARIGTLDALLAVHVLAVIALDMVQPDGTGLQRSTVIGGLLGLAFLVKGPVGVALPLVVVLAGRTAAGRDVLPSFRSTVTAILAWCAVVLPWGLVFLQRVGGATTAGIVKSEVIARSLGGGVAHLEPWWFYLKVVAVAFLPWLAPLVMGTVRGLARWRDAESPTGPYAAAGLVAGLVFFSVSKGKLPNYILPLAPLAALVITFELGQELVDAHRRRWGPTLVATTLIVLTVALAAAAAADLETRLRGIALVGALVYGAAGVFSLVGIMKRSPRWVYAAGVAGSVLFLVAVVEGTPPVLATKRSAAPLVAAVPMIQSSRPLVLVEMGLPSLTYYADRVPERIEARSLADRMARGDDDPILVMDRADWSRIPGELQLRLREIGRSGKLRAFERIDPARK
jgi:4-amino-4-deoxy-L-arabinose transferase